MEQHVQDLHRVLGELRRMRLTLDGVGLTARALRSPRPQAADFALVDALHILAPRAESQGVRLIADVDTMPVVPFDAATAPSSSTSCKTPCRRVAAATWCA